MASAPRIRHSRRVHGRTGLLALGAGFVVLLGLALGLLKWTRRAAPTATATATRAREPSAEPAAEVERAAPRTAAGATGEHRAGAPRERAAPRVARPDLAPNPGSFTRELKRDENGKLVPMIAADQLSAELPRAEAPMKACLERSGRRPTGKATLSFTVTAGKNNKLIIETTGIQDPDTLADYPDLLECMHQTASVLVLDRYPVPELGTPIYVRRHVRVANGELAEDSIFNFSYNP